MDPVTSNSDRQCGDDRVHHGDDRKRKELKRLVDILPGLDCGFDFRSLLCHGSDP